jgi:flagellar L-ring protein precursor FlgH
MKPLSTPRHLRPTGDHRLALTLLAAAILAAGPAARAQSLWPAAAPKSMYADKRASSVGDLITIIVKESTTASKDNKTSTAKKNSLDASITSAIYSGWLAKAGNMPALKYASDHEFSGSGSIANNESIVAQVAVRVIDVLPNRSMVIEGTRETSFGGEKQNIVLHGIVRAEDIAADNTVYSYNVADAKITIIGKGTVSDAQRKGWFTKIWDKVSPF